MSVAPDIDRVGYSGFAKSLHWIVALCVLTTVPVGILMGRVGDPLSGNLYNFHKSLGATILTLMTVRIIYRLIKGAPPHHNLPAFYRIAGSINHWALYIMLIATPIVGWVMNSAFGGSGFPFFGLFELPALISENKPLYDRLAPLHGFMGFTVGVLFCMHIGAALFHYFIRRDGVLQRMLPGR